MNADSALWFGFAEENLKSAEVLVESNLYNPCLQNAQQSMEKALKAILLEKGLPLRKTHSTSELMILLEENEIEVDYSKDERDLIDSIYLPTKYPLGSVLPHFEPNTDVARQCIDIAERVIASAKQVLSGG